MGKLLEEAKERFTPTKVGFTYLREGSEIPITLSEKDINLIKEFVDYKDKSSWYTSWFKQKKGL